MGFFETEANKKNENIFTNILIIIIKFIAITDLMFSYDKMNLKREKKKCATFVTQEITLKDLN